MSKKKKHVYARIACMTVHVGEVKNSKFNFQLNIITTLIFGNQFCPYQELLWLHFIVIIMIIMMMMMIIIIIIIIVDKSQGFPPIPGI